MQKNSSFYLNTPSTPNTAIPHGVKTETKEREKGEKGEIKNLWDYAESKTTGIVMPVPRTVLLQTVVVRSSAVIIWNWAMCNCVEVHARGKGLCG